MVYFIQHEASGPIKIGSAKDPIARLASLQIGTPFKLHIRLLLEGYEELESEMHTRFRPLHLRGEWFNPGEDLLSFMKSPAGFTSVVLRERSPTRWVRPLRTGNRDRARLDLPARLVVNLPEELSDRIPKAAASCGLSVQQWARCALQEYLVHCLAAPLWRKRRQEILEDLQRFLETWESAP